MTRQLVNIETAVADVARAKPGDRGAIVNEYLRGVANTATPGGKAVLHRRALFVTELRTRKVWSE